MLFRSDLVLSGCAILSAICRLWPVGTLRVADRGVREGILMSLMTGTAPDNVYGDFDEPDEAGVSAASGMASDLVTASEF